jgi:muramoyltetrapeptide carboxypeptidase LdcA involved in peptidoglycan recycling
MRYPKFIKKGDEISLIAPSFGLTSEPYYSRGLKAIEILKEKGFKIKEGKNIYSSIGYSAANAKDSSLEFMNSLNSDLIWSVGGGNFMYEILEDIDFKNMLKPVWFLGYSDNTNISYLLLTISDIASIYTICLSEIGTNKLYKSQEDLLDLIEGKKLVFKGYPKFELESLKSEDYYAPYNLTEKTLIKGYNNKNIEMEGRLIGGCIDCLRYIVGTNLDHTKEFLEKYKDDGFIWFLESCDLNSADLRLSILQLKRAGWFKYVKGFIFGRPYKLYDESFGISQEEAITFHLKDLGVPIILNADLGHLKPTIPFINGAIGKVSLKGQDFKIEYILK